MKRYGIQIVVAVSILWSIGNAYASSQSDQKTCDESKAKQFTQASYDGYLKLLGNPSPSSALAILSRHSPHILSKQLRDGLAADERIKANSPGYSVGLEADPLLNAQDPGEKYLVTEVKGSCPTFYATVVNSNDQNNNVVVSVTFVYGHMEITDVKYPDGSLLSKILSKK